MAVWWRGSDYDAATARYRLVVRRGAQAMHASIASSRRPFDVSLGPDSRGRVVALYTRCRTASHGCDVYRYDVLARRERKDVSVSSPTMDEAWPVQWRDHLAFVRRARAYVVDGYSLRPDPRGKRGGGQLMDCDVPYVKSLSTPAPSRRLDRGLCAPTTGMSIRGERIVQVTDLDQGGAGSESQVRVLRTQGGAGRVLARAVGGEGGYSPFASPSQSATDIYLTRTGFREGTSSGVFLRFTGVAKAADRRATERAGGRSGGPRRARRVLVRASSRAAHRGSLRAPVLRVTARVLPARPRIGEPVLAGDAGAAAATTSGGREIGLH